MNDNQTPEYSENNASNARAASPNDVASRAVFPVNAAENSVPRGPFAGAGLPSALTPYDDDAENDVNAEYSGREAEYSETTPLPLPPEPLPPEPLPPEPLPPESSRDVEMGIMEHLAELRARILRCVGVVFLAMILTWQLRDSLLAWFSKPMLRALKEHGGIVTTTGPTEGFMLYLQITFVAALLLAMPVILYQVWAFIEPALTRTEKRYGGILIPFATLLFFAGGALGYVMAPLFFEFFLQFQPPGTAAFWSYADTALFLAKMLLAFGIMFQVPVVTIFLNKLGVVSRNWLIEYWRHAVVVIFIIVAIVTPTWDPLSLMAAAVPPCLLYGVSIWLIKWL